MVTKFQNGLSTKDQFIEALHAFKQKAQLSSSEESDFAMTSLDDLKNVVRQMEHDQERKRRMMNMKRLDPFLKSMEEYGKIIEIFVNVNEVVAFIWGPMKFILQVASTFSEALHCILDAYQEIGEELPLLISYQSMFSANDQMKKVLRDIYTDILEFHREAMKHFRSKIWKQVFRATWKGFNLKLEHIKKNMARHRQLIESRASLIQFEEIQCIRQHEDREYKDKIEYAKRKRERDVMEWLSPFIPDELQESYRAVTSVSPEAGRWLFENPKVQDWLALQYCSTPLLWLNGIPGAGKTILASLIVDKASKIPNASVLYFYFKFRDQTRNNMLSAAKSISAQVIRENGNGDILYHMYEKKSFGGSIALKSPGLAKEMLHIALRGSPRTIFIVLDGLDECERRERRDITAWFQEEVEKLPASELGSIRVLFVSQDDGVGRNDLAQVPVVKVSPAENREDIKVFAESWQKKIEERFGNLRAAGFHLANIVTARSQGLFIFAQLFAEYLFGLGSLDSIKQELHPSKLPVRLDDVYERILYRITESQSEVSSTTIKKILGWIVSAQRPMRWREIQGAVSVDLEKSNVNLERRLLDSPDILFASLVQEESDGNITLVHSTAGEYLRRTEFVHWRNMDHSLAMLSLAYLSLPQFDMANLPVDTMKSIMSGFYSFSEYALSCWSLDLEVAVVDASKENDLGELVETLDVFMSMHWKALSKTLPVSQLLKRKLDRLEKADSYKDLLQAASWMKMRLKSFDDTYPEEEPLDLVQVIKVIRAIFEEMIKDKTKLSSQEHASLIDFYGKNWFKCPRINCYYFHQGFCGVDQRNEHIARHERPFICTVTGCHWANFGFAAGKELQKHMFEFHGFDMLNEDEFPEEQLSTAPSPSLKHPLAFSCHLCPKKFTRKHNLESHIRVHNNEKPFQCAICGEKFTRKNDSDRHERGHGEKGSVCFGLLEDGTSWGCQASFGRQDKLADHLRSRVGRKCIRPMLLQQLKNGQVGTTNESQIQQQADELLSERSLPAFEDFLRLSGLSSGPRTV